MLNLLEKYLIQHTLYQLLHVVCFFIKLMKFLNENTNKGEIINYIFLNLKIM